MSKVIISGSNVIVEGSCISVSTSGNHINITGGINREDLIIDSNCDITLNGTRIDYVHSEEDGDWQDWSVLIVLGLLALLFVGNIIGFTLSCFSFPIGDSIMWYTTIACLVMGYANLIVTVVGTISMELIQWWKGRKHDA